MAARENNIITCDLMGGLGNQLFQISATIVCGLEMNRKIVFPYSEVLRTGTVRSTYWNDFLNGLKTFTCPAEELLVNRFFIYKEEGFRYKRPQPNVRSDNNLYLSGYFQSYKYFDSKKDMLFKLFRLRSQKEALLMQQPHLIDAVYNNISIHFRLGDYKNIQDHHPLMSYQYYENALSHVLSNKSGRSHKVLYFSQFEDNILVSENYIKKLKSRFPSVVFIKIDDAIPDWKQMLLMSCCDDNIIANSTFSWWGAYFNENPSKVVCYPEIWFGPKLTHDVSDLFPEGWNKMSCS
jgi:hypothetical protein